LRVEAEQSSSDEVGQALPAVGSARPMGRPRLLLLLPLTGHHLQLDPT